MNDIIGELKHRNEYTETPGCCGNCRFFSIDNRTNPYHTGDRCVRNPDLTFRVSATASCNKWTAVDTDK